MSVKKVLLVLTSHAKIDGTEIATGWYLPELSHPYFRFKKEGYLIDFASINGGTTTVSPSSLDMNDEENKLFWENPETRSLTENTKSLSEFDGKSYDVVFFVGGFGTMWDFPFSSHVDRVGREVYEVGGIVGAVCHGPIALSNIRLSSGELLIAGKGVAGFSNDEEAAVGLESYLPEHKAASNKKSCEDVLQTLGANYTKANAWGVHVVNDSRVITGQNPMSAKSTADAIVAALQ
jgi:putative intracellular protease/amidase